MFAADVVVKGFEKTGIMNALDAIEEHLVWDEDKASEADVEFGGADKTTTSILAAVTQTKTVPLGYTLTKHGMVKLGGG